LSFSAQVKNELARAPLANKPCCLRAELCGLLLYSGIFSCRKIRLSTENLALKKRIPLLFQRTLGFAPEVLDRGEDKKATFTLEEEDKLRLVFDAFGYELRDAPVHLNLSILEERCCKASFLRGAFLAGGSVMNPEKRYHLELASHHKSLTGEVMSLLLDLDFSPRVSERNNDYVIYLKESGAIEDFLTAIGAQLSALSIMEIKVEKEIRNEVNRRTNCDDANISKVVATAQRQVAAIRALRERGALDRLPEALRQTAELRETYPELALKELAALHDPPVSKPGLAHRLNRLTALAKELDYE